MDFTGHKLIIINKSWCFDITEFIGYKTKVSDNNVTEYTKAFVVQNNIDNLTFIKEIGIVIPAYILKKVEKIINGYNTGIQKECKVICQ